MSDIKAGDVVELKSGGPRMTVSFLSRDSLDNESVRCIWFAGEGSVEISADDFYACTLDVVKSLKLDQE